MKNELGVRNSADRIDPKSSQCGIGGEDVLGVFKICSD